MTFILYVVLILVIELSVFFIYEAVRQTIHNGDSINEALLISTVCAAFVWVIVCAIYSLDIDILQVRLLLLVIACIPTLVYKLICKSIMRDRKLRKFS